MNSVSENTLLRENRRKAKDENPMNTVVVVIELLLLHFAKVVTTPPLEQWTCAEVPPRSYSVVI